MLMQSGHGCTQGAPPCTAIAGCTTEVTVPQRAQQVQVTLACAQRAECSVQAWLRSLGQNVGQCRRRHIRVWLRRHLPSFQPCLDQHLSFVANLTVPLDHVAVQEDKDKASCWILPTVVYQKLLALMVSHDVDHWVRHQGCAADIAEKYRQAHVTRLPPYVQASFWGPF